MEVQHFIDALTAGTSALKEHGLVKWLSDDRNNSGRMFPADQERVFKEWTLPAIEAGWRYWAVVMPEEIVVVGSMLPTFNRLHEHGLYSKAFSDPDEALEWLNIY